MKERPIIYSGWSVRAILDGRKTMTRRVVNCPPFEATDDGILIEWAVGNIKCPYGQLGDRLWVKENLRRIKIDGQDSFWAAYDADVATGLPGLVFWGEHKTCVEWEWKRNVLPAAFMPRWASRITLEITDISVEKVQEIDYEGMKAEGCFPENVCGCNTKKLQELYWIPLWNSINAKRGYGWDVNPMVWVISFKRIGE